MNDALARVAELVARETGIVIKESRFPGLAAALGRIAPGMDAERFLAEVGGGVSSGPLTSRLIDEIAVKETYFFREPRELRALDWHALVEMRRTRGAEKVRVWVSACATGEEAYTLAILASEALSQEPPPVSVVATDVSAAALERAEVGRYSARALRTVPSEIRARYFRSEDDRLVVRDSVRSLVRFRRHNLVNDPVPPPGEVPFDVIACRNVLIYFEPATVVRIVERLEAALRVDGTLILGAADRLTGTGIRLSPQAPSTGPRKLARRHQPARRERRRPLGLDEPAPRRRAMDAPGGAAATPEMIGPPAAGRPRHAEHRLEQALLAADGGNLEATLAITDGILAADPLDADAHFVRGLAELSHGDPDAAAVSFRRATYIDPSFGLAAFELGRAHEARGEPGAARRAYEQALYILNSADDRHRAILDYVDLNNVTATCRARLEQTD